MSNKRAKISRKQQEDSQERLIVDPYETIATPVIVCNGEDHAKKKNCTKNPWCVYGLGEKEGIWRTSNTIINSLGPDPNDCLRSYNSKNIINKCLYPPAGLRNLGATCYLNVLIQSLFHNLLVQDAVFNMEADGNNGSNDSVNRKPAAQDEMLPVILALQSSFAHMKLCHNSVVDLTRFVELLGLNKSTQQDPQEFNKLFFAKIESANLTTREPARASFNDLLSGRVKYSTRCNGCGQERVPPEHPFHELDLSIEGVHSVEEALANYTAVEHLTGENQYECATCRGRRDAQRCTIILKAPTVLNLHLLRYGYDRETYERKKLTSEVTFQDTMEVCGERFKLVSVLYHKGRSAYGGHYVCDALDWRTGEWWHYDDDTVCATTNPSLNMNPSSSSSNTTNIENSAAKTSYTTTSHTNSEPMCIDLLDTPTTSPIKSPKRNTATSSSKTKPMVLPIAVEDDNIEDTDPDEWVDSTTKGKNKRTLGASKKTTTAASGDAKGTTKGKGGNSRKKRAVEVDLTDSVDNTSGGGAGTNKATKLGFNRKRDAYMFTYVKVTSFDQAMQTTRIEPSTTLIEEVQRASTEFDQKVTLYNTRKERLLEEIAQRKASYERVRGHLAPATGITVLTDHKFILVPAWWLNLWIKGDASTLQHSGDVKSITNTNTCSTNCGSSNDITSSTNAVVDLDADEKISEQGDKTENNDVSVVDMTGASQEPISNTNNTSKTLTTKCPEINMTSYLCKHGTGLDTTHIERFKLISPEAYNTIFCSPCSWQQMNVVLDQSTFRCDQCYSAVVHQRTVVQSLNSTYNHMIQLIDANSESSYESDDTVQYWLSKQWLTQLRKYHTSLQRAEPGKNKSGAFAKLFTASNAAKLNTSNAEELKQSAAEDVPVSTLDQEVNTNLFCPHGAPVLNYSKRAIKISEAAWLALMTEFPLARPLLYGTEVCEICVEEASNDMESARQSKEHRAAEIALPALKSLCKMKRINPLQLDEGLALSADDLKTCLTKFYVIDGKWLAHWRTYIQNVQFPAPPPLTNAALRCHCHYPTTNDKNTSTASKTSPTTTTNRSIMHRALLPPVLSGIEHGIAPNTHDVQDLLVYKFTEQDLYNLPTSGSKDVMSSAMDVDCAFIGTNSTDINVTNTATGVYPRAEIITEDQWNALLRCYPVSPSGHDVINLEDTNDSYAITNPDNESVYTLTLKYNLKQQTWHYTPSICMQCVETQQLKADLSISTYLSATLNVVYYRDESEFLALFHKVDSSALSTINATNVAGASAAGTALSTESTEGGRRSTRTRGGKKHNASIIADSSDTLSLIRLKVYQAFTAVDLPPTNQRLFDCKGNALSGQTKTLAECGVKIGDKLYVLTGNSGADGGGGEWEYSDFLTTHSSSRAVEHGFGGTLLLGSTTNTNTNTNTNNTNNNATDATANANTSDATNGNNNTRVTGGLTRTSSGTSHDSAVDLFFQDHAFDAPIMVPHKDTAALSENSEFQLQIAKALALSAHEAAAEKAIYEQIDTENAAQMQDIVAVSLTQESSFTFNTTSSSTGGDGNNRHASTTQEPASQPATQTQRPHKLYSLQELQQHKQQQQAGESKTKPHPRVQKVRQEEKEEGEISTSAVSTFGSDDETGSFSFDKAVLSHAPQVDRSPVRSSHSEPTSELYTAPSAEIITNTQQSEDPQCFTATSTQESGVVEEGELHANQDDQETEPQFEIPPVVATSGSIQAANKEEKKNKHQDEMKAISPAELLEMLGATGSSTCMTPDPYKSNCDNHDAKRGSSSKEPISLENTPVGSPDK